MKNHHEFGPSSLERRQFCPGSYRLERDLPALEQSEAAAEGTELHAQVADAISLYCTGKCAIALDERVVSCLEYFEAVAMGDEYASANDLRAAIASGVVTVKTELHLEYTYCGAVQFSGTADVVVTTPTRLVGIDWKFGRREVTAADRNLQGKAYGLSAMQHFKRLACDFHFYNPVINQKSSAHFNSAAALALEIMSVIRAAQAADAPIVHGEKQCRYCKANHHGTCPAINGELVKASDKAVELAPRLALACLSNAELCELKNRCDLVAALGKRVDARIKAICEEHGSCGKYQLRRMSGGRELPDISEAFCRTVDWFSQEEFLSCCTLSVAQLEKLFTDRERAAGKVKTAKEAKELFADRLEGLIFPKPEKLVIERQKNGANGSSN